MFLQMTHHFQIGAPPAISPESETGEDLLRNLQLFQIEEHFPNFKTTGQFTYPREK